MSGIIRREKIENEIVSEAIYSKCYKFRYSITKRYKTGKGNLLFILLNPSIATENIYDPTLLRCKKRAEKSLFKQFRVCNLFAFRSTNPKKLHKIKDPTGPQNNKILRNSIKWSDKVICSWGNLGTINDRNLEVTNILKEFKTPVFHLGLTKNKQPKHLLYISYKTIPNKWF